MMTLKAHRASRLLTVRALAEQADVTTKTITDIEHGRVMPQFGTMKKIAATLGVEPTEVTEFAATIERAADGKEAA